jgi:hypothetical protein
LNEISMSLYTGKFVWLNRSNSSNNNSNNDFFEFDDDICGDSDIEEGLDSIQKAKSVQQRRRCACRAQEQLWASLLERSTLLDGAIEATVKEKTPGPVSMDVIWHCNVPTN